MPLDICVHKISGCHHLPNLTGVINDQSNIWGFPVNLKVKYPISPCDGSVFSKSSSSFSGEVLVDMVACWTWLPGMGTQAHVWQSCMQKEEAEQGCTISYLVNTPLGQLGVCRMCHLTGQNQVSYLVLLGLTIPKFSGDVPARGVIPHQWKWTIAVRSFSIFYHLPVSTLFPYKPRREDPSRAVQKTTSFSPLNSCLKHMKVSGIFSTLKNFEWTIVIWR